MHKREVFSSGKGWPVYRIPGLAVTNQGTLLCVCEGRTSVNDWDARAVLLARSTDGGKTFSAPVTLNESGTETVNNPVLITTGEGSTLLLYQLNYNRLFVRVSEDDGATFGASREITAVMDGYRSECSFSLFGIGPGHGIETDEGMLVVPVWLAYGEGRNHFPSHVSFITSEDGGSSWQRGSVMGEKAPGMASPNETTVCQTRNGKLLFSIRNRGDGMCRYQAVSRNGKKFEGSPVPVYELPDPRCFGSLASSGHSCGFVNCADEKERRKLTVYQSVCNGSHFLPRLVLEKETAGYADLAFSQDGRMGYCLYEKGVPGKIVLASFSWQDVRAEESAGAVLYTEENGVRKYVVVLENEGFFSLPKGHLEAWETAEQAALREIFEETGIRASLVPGFLTSTRYRIPNGNLKRVTYFLARFDGQEPRARAGESAGVQLLPYDEANRLLRSHHRTLVLAKADAWLDKGDKDE